MWQPYYVATNPTTLSIRKFYEVLDKTRSIEERAHCLEFGVRVAALNINDACAVNEPLACEGGLVPTSPPPPAPPPRRGGLLGAQLTLGAGDETRRDQYGPLSPAA